MVGMQPLVSGRTMKTENVNATQPLRMGEIKFSINIMSGDFVAKIRVKLGLSIHTNLNQGAVIAICCDHINISYQIGFLLGTPATDSLQ